MRNWVIEILVLSALVLSACAPSAPNRAQNQIEIASNAFVLLPCSEHVEEVPCTLVIAGGKRILFGAPAGITNEMRAEDLGQLDAVMLFSLRAMDTEGLDEVRNASWRAGRDAPLLVIGPIGVEDFVTALNKAYEQADALRIVDEGIPPGGFDAAILNARRAVSEQIIFNTGDLTVERLPSGYHIRYDARASAYLLDCGEPAPLADEETVLSVSCDGGSGSQTWPLAKPVFVTEN